MTDTTQPNVRPLVPRDRFRTSAEPIVRLYIALGDAGAERTICSALDDLALRLSLGRFSTRAEIETAAARIRHEVLRLRAIGLEASVAGVRS